MVPISNESPLLIYWIKLLSQKTKLDRIYLMQRMLTSHEKDYQEELRDNPATNELYSCGSLIVKC